MNRLFPSIVHFIASVLAASLICVDAYAQEPGNARVTFTTPASKYRDGTIAVAGTLSLPERKSGRLPAVLILHTSGGVDGRGASNAAALNKAGIATLEIEMFGRGQTVDTHPTVQQNMPHVFEAPEYLATRPEIDPARIGVMGFSWGRMLAIVSATESDSCAKFVASANKAEGAAFSRNTYPGAYHGWDAPRDAQSTSPLSNKGRGGVWRGYANAAIGERSRRDAVQFFSDTL